jgi:hypothetical protein
MLYFRLQGIPSISANQGKEWQEGTVFAHIRTGIDLVFIFDSPRWTHSINKEMQDATMITYNVWKNNGILNRAKPYLLGRD